MDTATPTYAQRVAHTVSAAMQAGDWSEKALAESTGIPRVTLRRRLAGSPFDVSELERIAAALGTTVSALLTEGAVA